MYTRRRQCTSSIHSICCASTLDTPGSAADAGCGRLGSAEDEKEAGKDEVGGAGASERASREKYGRTLSSAEGMSARLLVSSLMPPTNCCCCAGGNKRRIAARMMEEFEDTAEDEEENAGSPQMGATGKSAKRRRA